jgi:hypothetical protein
MAHKLITENYGMKVESIALIDSHFGTEVFLQKQAKENLLQKYFIIFHPELLYYISSRTSLVKAILAPSYCSHSQTAGRCRCEYSQAARSA